MATQVIRFLSIVLVGLIAGTLCGIWLGYNPATFSVSTYLEYQQNAIRSLNTIMPLLGLVAIILILISAFQQKADKTVFITLIATVILLVIGGLVTRFGNQPINAIVMTWNKATVPDNWTELRDKWWSFHIIRTIATLAAFCLIVWAGIKKSQ